VGKKQQVVMQFVKKGIWCNIAEMRSAIFQEALCKILRKLKGNKISELVE
jgi:hypothetical protein